MAKNMSKICMNQTKKTIRAIGAQYNILTHSLWRFKCSDASNREPSTRHTTHEIVTFFSHPPPPPPHKAQEKFLTLPEDINFIMSYTSKLKYKALGDRNM